MLWLFKATNKKEARNLPKHVYSCGKWFWSVCFVHHATVPHTSVLKTSCSVIFHQKMTPPTLSGLRSRGGLVGPPPRAPLPPRGPPRPRPGRPRSPKLISSWDVMSLAGLRKWWSLAPSPNGAWSGGEKQFLLTFIFKSLKQIISYSSHGTH